MEVDSGVESGGSGVSEASEVASRGVSEEVSGESEGSGVETESSIALSMVDSRSKDMLKPF